MVWPFNSRKAQQVENQVKELTAEPKTEEEAKEQLPKLSRYVRWRLGNIKKLIEKNIEREEPKIREELLVLIGPILGELTAQDVEFYWDYENAAGEILLTKENLLEFDNEELWKIAMFMMEELEKLA